mgnify:CR=1 FL=1
MFKGCKGRRICIDLEFDFDQLARRDGSGKSIIRIEQQNVLLRISLQKGGLDSGVHRLFPLFRLEVQAVGADFLFQRWQILAEIKALRRHQGKVQIFGKAIQAIEDPQRCPSIEGCVLEKSRATQSAQYDLLNDLLDRVFLVVRSLRLIGSQHLFKYLLHVGSPF